MPSPNWLLLLLSCASVTSILGDIILRPSCSTGWFYFRSHCYGYFRKPQTWSDAELECQAFGNGAHLASVLDQKEARIIAKHIKGYQRNQPVWIGLNDPQKNNQWKWIDGGIFLYRAWTDKSYQRNKSCAEMAFENNFLTWNRSECTKRQHFICKYRP
ncbi:regenerating islet-derived protein 4 [Macrotis lagotis]|uniref:regenerating islet-derived protein 4 n=1 Tax=Macrotis lagotis TaxID=92651 RepID=UPI003D68A2D2